jgi:enoyl-CoA hydratase
MDDETVKLIKEDEVSEIFINRPNNLNALNPDVLQSLILILEKLEKNAKTKVLIITGSGDKAFVAGADIHSMSQLGPRAIADYVELGQRAMRKIETAPFPVIASVNGFALGGGLELALACDLIIASESAKLGQPEVNLGILPGFGGTQRLAARCGLGTTRRLVYSGEMIDAEEALRLGLVDYLAAPGELWEKTKKIAGVIAAKAPLAVKHSKEVIRKSQDASLLSGLRLEVEAFLQLFSTVDREEGMNAFLQKRPAKFIGK